MEIEHHCLGTIDSTNRFAKREYLQFNRKALTVISAKGQTHGYGRFHRPWVSPDNHNIYITFVFFVSPQFTHLSNSAHVMALTAAALCSDLGFDCKLKWPNDLLLHHQKLAGVLCEVIPCEPDLCVIAGIGLNVNMDAEACASINQPATSLKEASGHRFEIEQVRELLIAAVATNLQDFLSRGFAPFRERYSERLIHTPGDQLRVQSGNELLHGTFRSIDASGRLLLDVASRGVVCISAGVVLGEESIREPA